MMKLALFLVVVALSITFCTQEKNNIQITPKEMLEIVIFHNIYHLQSESERALLKKHNIKSASLVKNIINKSKIDSATYLTYDKKGKLESMTTTECTTVGCLPYIIKQIFIYSNNKIRRMDDYTFKYRYSSTMDYWRVIDTNELSKFDWEDYSYINDTVKVESGAIIKKYVRDKNSNIRYIKYIAKTNNQIAEVFYEYSDSNIFSTSKNSISDRSLTILYKVKDDKTVVKEFQINGINYSNEFVFNKMGLLEEILAYKNGNYISKTKINYSYF